MKQLCFLFLVTSTALIGGKQGTRDEIMLALEQANIKKIQSIAATDKKLLSDLEFIRVAHAKTADITTQIKNYDSTVKIPIKGWVYLSIAIGICNSNLPQSIHLIGSGALCLGINYAISSLPYLSICGALCAGQLIKIITYDDKTFPAILLFTQISSLALVHQEIRAENPSLTTLISAEKDCNAIIKILKQSRQIHQVTPPEHYLSRKIAKIFSGNR